MWRPIKLISLSLKLMSSIICQNETVDQTDQLKRGWPLSRILSKCQTDQFEAQTDVTSSQTDQFEKELDKILRFAELISVALTNQFGADKSVWHRGYRAHQFDAHTDPHNFANHQTDQLVE